MANRRNLKQAVHSEIEEMLFDLSVLYSIAPEAEQGDIEQLICEVIDAERNTIAKVSHTDGRGSGKIVRQYYRTVIEQYEAFADRISQQVQLLLDRYTATTGADAQ